MNIIFAIADTIMCGLAVVGLCFGAYHFDRWWILLFSIIPLLLFYSRPMVMDADYEPVEGGGDEDAR